MNDHSFGVDLNGSWLADVKRRVLEGFSAEDRRRLAGDVEVEPFLIPNDAKVSCKYGDACTSPSRRDQTKSKAWLCGSSFSHDDRISGCVAYLRFENFLKNGKNGLEGGFFGDGHHR